VYASTDSRTKFCQSRLGSVLRGKYTLDSLLGVGGTAAVYAATHRNGKRFAIKILHPEAALVPELRSRFLREGYLANQVSHPGAPSILDDDCDEQGLAYLVMELLRGETVEDRWYHTPHGRMPTAEVLAIAAQTLDVLATAHAKGIVHRDLKPSNIFLCETGELKVLDFGIARLANANPNIAETLGLVGTPAFMPPEQARGRPGEVGAHTDIWAVGATMFFLLTGRLVHERETVSEQIAAAVSVPAPQLGSVLADLPESVCRIVDQALAFAPKDRFTDVRQMQAAVREAFFELTGERLTTIAGVVRTPVRNSDFARQATVPLRSFGDGEISVPRPELPKPARWKRPVALVGAGVAVCAAIAGALLALRTNTSPAPSTSPALAGLVNTAPDTTEPRAAGATGLNSAATPLSAHSVTGPQITPVTSNAAAAPARPARERAPNTTAVFPSKLPKKSDPEPVDIFSERQ
jgi:serine/threonine-protein kinase